MANIRLYDPFTDLDDLFKGIRNWPARAMKEAPSIKLEVKEDDQSYTVHAEMPGVRKDDINVTVDGNVVTITGEVKSEKEQKEKERVIHSERYYGSVSRSFTLAQSVDEGATTAKFNDGVLELRLPKRTGPATKRIQVS
ncbi:MAG: Hsp20 family protein [Betaproteobacteria bacterium]|nr:Hsp20 family protein [Betaproteobacteria bacterium]